MRTITIDLPNYDSDQSRVKFKLTNNMNLTDLDVKVIKRDIDHTFKTGVTEVSTEEVKEFLHRKYPGWDTVEVLKELI